MHIEILTFDSDLDDHQSALEASYCGTDCRMDSKGLHHDERDNRKRMNYSNRQKMREHFDSYSNPDNRSLLMDRDDLMNSSMMLMKMGDWEDEMMAAWMKTVSLWSFHLF